MDLPDQNTWRSINHTEVYKKTSLNVNIQRKIYLRTRIYGEKES